MVDIAHRVGIKAPASQVYQALATPEGVAAWWAEDTHGDRVAGGSVYWLTESWPFPRTTTSRPGSHHGAGHCCTGPSCP